MSAKAEDRTDAGWGCLVLMVSAGFSLTFCAWIFFGMHWIWPIQFFVGFLVLCVHLAKKAEVKK